MKNQDGLFQLIKSLDKQEKRYFSLYASKYSSSEGSNYLKLFELVDEQDTYDEKLLKQKLPGKLSGQLAFYKIYLFQLILKSLESYHNSINGELYSLLRHIEILYDRGAYVQVKKLIRKARKLAYKYERDAQLLSIITWERTLMYTEMYSGKTEADLELLAAEENGVISRIRNISEFRDLSARIFLIMRKKQDLRTETELWMVKKIMESPLLQSIDNAICYESKSLFHIIHGAYCFLIGDYQNAYKYNKLRIELMEANPSQLAVNIKAYISTLNNLSGLGLSLRKYEECLEIASKLQNLPVSSDDIRLQLFIQSNTLFLNLYISTGQFDKGLERIPQVEEGISLHGTKIQASAQILFSYIIAYTYIGVNKYDQAVNWLNKIINSPETDMRSDIYCISRILYLIVHFELGNNELLRYLVKSTYRFLFSRSRLYKFETILLNFIGKKLPRILNRAELLAAFTELKHELEVIASDPYEERVFEYFDFISWLESKIIKKPFAEVLRAKVQANAEKVAGAA